MARSPINCIKQQPVSRLNSNGYCKDKAGADFLFGTLFDCTGVTPLTVAESLLLY